MGEHVAAIAVMVAQPGQDIGDSGVLVEVVTDQRRHISIDHLVVGHSCAGRVGEGDVAGPPGAHEPRNAHSGIGPEHFRVQEEVVDPTVDDVDTYEPADGAHVHAVVAIDEKVLALHQVGTHLLSQEGVLEVGRVEDPRCQYHDDRCLARARRKTGEEACQLVGVVVDRLDVEIAEQVGEDPLGHQPVFEHVRDARWDPQVVLEHVHRPVRIPDQVAAANVGPHTMAWRTPALRAEVQRRGQHLGRDHSISHDPGRAVDVVNEKVEGGEPLDEPARFVPTPGSISRVE